jgi:hypothetical protein
MLCVVRVQKASAAFPAVSHTQCETKYNTAKKLEMHCTINHLPLSSHSFRDIIASPQKNSPRYAAKSLEIILPSIIINAVYPTKPICCFAAQYIDRRFNLFLRGVSF